MDSILIDVVHLAVRTLFLVCVPIALILGVVGTLASAFQGVTNIHEGVVGYGTKLLVLCAVLYLYFPSITNYLTSLTFLALR